jgi:eukaryotic-like serine/threonine-protein kinase
MLTGKRAFEGENPASVIAAVLEREPVPLAISPPLDRVVERCLAKDPDQRFQNAIDLLTALNWAVEQTPVASSATRRWWIGGMAAALALVFAAGWTVSRIGQRPAAEGRPLHFQITPPKGPASYFELFASLSVSPDGRFATYSASVNGRHGLWLHPLDGSADRLLVDLVNDTNATPPFWSPDAKSVGWLNDHKVWRTDLSGGTPLLLCNTGSVNTPAAVWTGDGRILFGTSKGLMQIPESGGAPTPLTQVDASLGESGHSVPQLLPGGLLLYFASNAKTENSAIYTAPLSTPSKRVLVTRSSGPALYAPGGDGKDYLLTVREQGLVAWEFDIRKLTVAGSPHAVVSQVGGPRQLIDGAVSPGGMLLYSGGPRASRFVWVDRAGKTIEAVSELNRYAGFRLSPNGKRFVAERGPDVATDLWLMDVDRHVFSLFAPPVANGQLEPPVWSSDGRIVLFNAQGRIGIYRKAIADSGEGERVMEWPAAVGGKVRRLCDWSRDGRFLLYETLDLETRRDLWFAPVTPDGRLGEGAQPKPYMRGPSAEWHGRFSPEPNPRWVAYESDETGRDEIYIASFPDAKRRLQVTSGGGGFPQWGPDGRELFYLSGDGMLSVVGLKNGAEGLEASPPQPLFPLTAISAIASPYEVSPDGKKILVNQAQPITELDVVVNWPALLRRQAAQ